MKKRIQKVVKYFSRMFLFFTILYFVGYVFRWNWVMFPGSCDPSHMKIQHDIIGDFAMACCSICVLLKVICVQFDLEEMKTRLSKNDRS